MNNDKGSVSSDNQNSNITQTNSDQQMQQNNTRHNQCATDTTHQYLHNVETIITPNQITTNYCYNTPQTIQHLNPTSTEEIQTLLHNNQTQVNYNILTNGHNTTR
jgi:hypothetical protein